ncbi:hypothetical protein M422DRAFT_265302 [Sphaerobolus stellatus SS14]|uniref:Fungal lipase-type domain-containing protein n=1 Tax=Sphaerobolus stellatus (strain SS14) TaxID=990650 RepID=A0A0C9UDN8_SPHS4|nr:hypothetical protein M422DRAFT_265302 [Sphaerobolus stellatus SS14]
MARRPRKAVKNATLSPLGLLLLQLAAGENDEPVAMLVLAKGEDEWGSRLVDGAVTALTTAKVNAFTPYTNYAKSAYCTPATTLAWSCANCNTNSDFIRTASGGTGTTIPYWRVRYDPTLKTVVVAHRGTNTTSIVSYWTDVTFALTALDSAYFPGITDLGIKVHNSFLTAHERAVSDILAATQKTLAAHPGASVTLVGHSLGAALALFDALYLPLHLPSGTTFKLVGYGMPRVGNDKFAEFINANFSDLTHINHEEDPVSILSGRALGFEHAHGEVHITDDGVWHACAGHDNTNSLCTVGTVTNIFVGQTADHTGPYNGISTGCS